MMANQSGGSKQTTVPTSSSTKYTIEQKIASGTIRRGPSYVKRNVDPKNPNDVANIVIRRRAGEGTKPLFERPDIRVNKSSGESAGSTKPRQYRRERYSSSSSSASPERYRDFSSSNKREKTRSPSPVRRPTKSTQRHGRKSPTLVKPDPYYRNYTPRPQTTRKQNPPSSTKEKVPYFIDQVREQDRLKKRENRSKTRSRTPPRRSERRARSSSRDRDRDRGRDRDRTRSRRRSRTRSKSHDRSRHNRSRSRSRERSDRDRRSPYTKIIPVPVPVEYPFIPGASWMPPYAPQPTRYPQYMLRPSIHPPMEYGPIRQFHRPPTFVPPRFVRPPSFYRLRHP